VIVDSAKHVIVFHTAKNPAQAVRVHAANCPLVTAARASKNGLIRVIDGDEFEPAIRDFQARIYPVRHCRCATKPNTECTNVK
jgi:hypothetical protein